MKKTIELNGNKGTIESAIAVLTAMGLTVIEDNGAETTASSPKEKKATKKTASSKKKQNDFPTAEYKAMAEECGCLSKKGTCYQSCRGIIYDAIGWDVKNDKPCKPKLTKAQAKKAVEKQLKENGWS